MSGSPSDACDLTLDPNTAHILLSLSEDNRKVKLVEEDQSYPDHPERFDSLPQVLGREALTGRCYWEVEWKIRVGIGVTYRGITRRGLGDSGLGYNNKSWCLYCYDGGYIARHNNRDTAIPLRAAGSTRVGVYLDRPAGSLSFYRVSPGGGGSSDTLTHIHTFWSSFTQEDLLPGVRLAWANKEVETFVCILGEEDVVYDVYVAAAAIDIRPTTKEGWTAKEHVWRLLLTSYTETIPPKTVPVLYDILQ
ncbi:unnamed protein product [Boreogadus saida]